MLTPNDIKEELSIAYVRAVASRAGFSVEEIHKDRDSVDLKICARGRLVDDATRTSPELAVQLKATVLDPVPPTELSFALKKKNYDDLIQKSLVPRILVVFVLPEDETQWLRCDEESLVLRRSGYWTSLRGRPATANETSETIKVPRSQTFDPVSLRLLLERVAREKEILP